MSAKKTSCLGKILTGVVTTFVAPTLAAVVAQQVGEWQDTLKCLVENQLPALTAGEALKPYQRGERGDRRDIQENALPFLPPRPLRSPR